jgi:putative ABC transport system permease protein
LRNYAAVATRVFLRNPVHAVVTGASLAIATAVAAIIGAFVVSEANYDTFWPGHKDIYAVTQRIPSFNGSPSFYWDTLPVGAAKALQSDYNDVVAATRLAPDAPLVQHNVYQAYEHHFDWVDSNFFIVFKLKSLHGDLATALSAPDTLVLTSSAARKYFGRDDVVGETLMVDPSLAPSTKARGSVFNSPHLMRVTAVVQDLPRQTSLDGTIFASSASQYSRTRLFEEGSELFGDAAYTFVLLRHGSHPETISNSFKDFVTRNFRKNPVLPIPVSLLMTPISEFHLSRPAENPLTPRGSASLLGEMSAIAILVLLIGVVNFVTLMTARAERRALETGVRKAVGATRRDLILRYMGESMVWVSLSVLAGLALAELALPTVGALLGRDLSSSTFEDGKFLVVVLVATLATGILAGFYPAVILSAFEPAAVLKGNWSRGAGRSLVRQTLVTLQFVIAISLVISTATVYRQTGLALANTLPVDQSNIVLVDDGCSPAGDFTRGQLFRDRVSRLPGVQAAACEFGDLSNTIGATSPVIGPSGRMAYFDDYPVSQSFFETYGLKPQAGRFFVSGEEVTAPPGHAADLGGGPIVLNDTAARVLGFKSPAAAVGQIVKWTPAGGPPVGSVVIGVVQDFTFSSIRRRIAPAMFVPRSDGTLAVRTRGRPSAALLQSIDAVWRQLDPREIQITTLQAQLRAENADVILQEHLVFFGSGVALFIACLGLFGMSSFAAERRIREIGLRRVMGARVRDVVWLLLWQLSRPVLVANLIAWPIAWWAMTQWLDGFAYRVDLPIWLFVGASVCSIAIGWTTIAGRAFAAARVSPSVALRYE